MNRRNTVQRLAVEKACKSLYHPTAEEITSKILSETKMGRATVFRNLKALVEEGKIVKLKFEDDSTRYDGNPFVHDHFLCRKCGEIVDIARTEQENCVLPRGQFKIEYKSVNYYGLCAKCVEAKSLAR